LLRDLIAAFERVDRNGAAGRAVIPRTILSKWFNVPVKFVAGSSRTF